MKQALKLKNVIFLPSVPKNQIPNLLSYFDCNLILAINSPLYLFGISPNKMFDYMMSKKPIIQAIESGNNMVEEAQCGFSVKGEDYESLALACQKMFNLSVEERNEMGAAGYDYVNTNHDYKMLAEKFSNLF